MNTIIHIIEGDMTKRLTKRAAGATMTETGSEQAP